MNSLRYTYDAGVNLGNLPDLIIETDIARGSSIIFYVSMLELWGEEVK